MSCKFEPKTGIIHLRDCVERTLCGMAQVPQGQRCDYVQCFLPFSSAAPLYCLQCFQAAIAKAYKERVGNDNEPTP